MLQGRMTGIRMDWMDPRGLCDTLINCTITLHSEEEDDWKGSIPQPEEGSHRPEWRSQYQYLFNTF